MKILSFVLFLALASPVNADIINVWMAVRDDASSDLTRWLQTYERELDDSVDTEFRVDERRFRHSWSMANLYFEDLDDVLMYAVPTVETILDLHPGHVRVIGAWWLDGRQVGMYWTRNDLGVIDGTVGVPNYPLDSRILEFMPDEVTFWDGEEWSRERPTEPFLIAVIEDQSPREFQ